MSAPEETAPPKARPGTTGTNDLGRALHGWRDRIAPETVGLPVGGVRRAAGLRREELAQLAALSVDYITRLEQGRATSPSPQVLASLARALRLSAEERTYLYLLAGQPEPGPGHISDHIPPGLHAAARPDERRPAERPRRRLEPHRVEPPLGGAARRPSALRGRERNMIWRHFKGLPGRVRQTPQQKADFEATMVGDLRAATARYPADLGLRSLVKDLRETGPAFAALWDSGIVGVHQSGAKAIVHPEIGTLTLDCDVLIAAGSDLRVVAYTAAPGSEAAARLGLLDVIGTQAMT